MRGNPTIRVILRVDVSKSVDGINSQLDRTDSAKEKTPPKDQPRCMRVTDRPEGGRGVFPESYRGRKVVIGLGNPYMKDDGVGIQVARQLKQMDLGNSVVVHESTSLEASLIWQFRDAAAIVVVDALASGASAGSVSRFTVAPRKGNISEIPSLHEMQLHDLIDLAGLNLLPCPLIIVAVEPKDSNLGEGLTDEVQAAVPRAVDEVIKLLGGAHS